MLYWLLVPLSDDVSVFNLFRYITVRTALAGITALVLSFLLGPVAHPAPRRSARSARRSGPTARSPTSPRRARRPWAAS